MQKRTKTGKVNTLAAFFVGIFCVLTVTATAQQLESRVIITDTKDSMLFKADGMGFDEAGNYCFEVGKENQKYFLLPGNKRIGPFQYISPSFSNDAGISDTYQESSPDSPWYYANYKGARLYGPVRGRQIRYADGKTRNNMAMVIAYKDTIYTYINGVVKHKEPGHAEEDQFSRSDDWCAFSPGGNVLYQVKDATGFSLYLNDKLLHQSPNGHSALHVNDNGDYLFATSEKPVASQAYDYWFFIHSKDTVLGPVRTVWQHELHSDGSYYFTGDDNGTNYVAANNRLYKDLNDVSHIYTPDASHALFSCIKNGKRMLYVDGKPYPLDYERVMYATVDKDGNFACYGLRKYYLYPFVNGKELPPLSKYGVRAIPVYISAKGSSYHIFRTDDSSYIYHDSMLLFQPLANRRQLAVTNGASLFDNVYDDDKAVFRPLTAIQTDSTAFFIYEGRLSHALPALSGNAYTSFGSPQAVGQILSGEINSSGYYVIRKTGDRQYEVLTNYTSVKIEDGPDKIVPGCSFLKQHDLIFFGTKANAFYRYQLKL